ncbi:hypothetical protein MNBD_UNCLBAC01-1700 [hydrothermal vent metagenome]|uniref:Uncharacterized protein n=1 Tax=hydrothermal vent metagenome TaxID=652676 RepID=A0A3B1D3D7_9ZZZZ
MNIYIKHKRNCLIYRMLNAFIALTFIFISLVPPAQAQVAVLNLPVPGTMLTPTLGYTPSIIKGLTIHPDNALEFDFIIGVGDDQLEGQAFEDESKKLIKYFLAALTTPEESVWVNLSPYEQDRIIPDGFGDTKMGRDMLAQDYLLKQLSASLMYPEDELGKKFWDRVYTKAQEQFGTTEIPMNTFNKIWIIPQKAVIFEKNASVFVVDSHLKVMLEEDYVALNENIGNAKFGLDSLDQKNIQEVSMVSSGIIRDILIPEIEKEVNQGEIFANLRQIYHSSILAAWYKKNLKESLLGQVYVDQGKTKGVDIKDKQINQKIYKQYVEAFKKGVYNYIKEDIDPTTQELIPRKYFSGGVGRFNEISAITENITSSPLTKQRSILVDSVAANDGDMKRVTAGIVEVSGASPVTSSSRKKTPLSPFFRKMLFAMLVSMGSVTTSGNEDVSQTTGNESLKILASAVEGLGQEKKEEFFKKAFKHGMIDVLGKKITVDPKNRVYIALFFSIHGDKEAQNFLEKIVMEGAITNLNGKNNIENEDRIAGAIVLLVYGNKKIQKLALGFLLKIVKDGTVTDLNGENTVTIKDRKSSAEGLLAYGNESAKKLAQEFMENVKSVNTELGDDKQALNDVLGETQSSASPIITGLLGSREVHEVVLEKEVNGIFKNIKTVLKELDSSYIFSKYPILMNDKQSNTIIRTLGYWHPKGTSVNQTISWPTLKRSILFEFIKKEGEVFLVIAKGDIPFDGTSTQIFEVPYSFFNKEIIIPLDEVSVQKVTDVVFSLLESSKKLKPQDSTSRENFTFSNLTASSALNQKPVLTTQGEMVIDREYFNEELRIAMVRGRIPTLGSGENVILPESALIKKLEGKVSPENFGEHSYFKLEAYPIMKSILLVNDGAGSKFLYNSHDTHPQTKRVVMFFTNDEWEVAIALPGKLELVENKIKVGRFRDFVKKLRKNRGASEEPLLKEGLTRNNHAFYIFPKLSRAQSAASPVFTTPPFGGINFDTNLINWQIKRDGKGIPLPMNLQPIESMQIDGFVPVILNVAPVSLPMLLGLNASDFENETPFASGQTDPNHDDNNDVMPFKEPEDVIIEI